MDQHRETGVDSHHRVIKSETNDAHKGYTTNVFVDRVTVREIGETMSRGAKDPFCPCNNT
jgi:hypothetical protein